MKQALMDLVGQILPILAAGLGTILTIALKDFLQNLATKWGIEIEEKKKQTTEKEAVQAVMAGMAKAQDDLVRQAKAASVDGRLTKEEIEQAKTVAFTHAVSIAKGPVQDLLINWGKSRVDSIIKQKLQELKTK